MIGKEILNIVRSLILEHLITPLCDKIILDTRESPNPVPLTDPVINGSNILSKILRKRFPISRIRVKKFCSSTEFTSSKNELNNFISPYSLIEGLENTITNEFINPSASQEIFYTE